jgi:uncharacterized membrane protein YeaQ/YmgE (transglycosylase-associated protein family)
MGRSTWFLEQCINPYIWCAVGGLVGWGAGMWMRPDGRIVMIENILVGVFGAFIGGDFIATLLNGGVVNDQAFSVRSLAFAVAGALVSLFLLSMMRRVVGPLRNSKKRSRDRN